MKVNYGLVVTNVEGEVFHFCGYEDEITEDDVLHLWDELHTDIEFKGEISEKLDTEEYFIAQAIPEVLKEIMLDVNKECDSNLWEEG